MVRKYLVGVSMNMQVVYYNKTLNKYILVDMITSGYDIIFPGRIYKKPTIIFSDTFPKKIRSKPYFTSQYTFTETDYFSCKDRQNITKEIQQQFYKNVVIMWNDIFEKIKDTATIILLHNTVVYNALKIFGDTIHQEEFYKYIVQGSLGTGFKGKHLNNSCLVTTVTPLIINNNYSGKVIIPQYTMTKNMIYIINFPEINAGDIN